MHDDLERKCHCGVYGGDHTAYHGLSCLKGKIDMNEAQTGMKEHERLVPELETLLRSPRVQECWESIVSIDPMGMFASRPTIAATYAKMEIPELKEVLAADPDGKIVDSEGYINCIKVSDG